METEEYSLTWKGHTQHIRDSFTKLLLRNNFCDVTLYAEGQRIGAHKVFLTACSGYFSELFADLQEERPIIVLKGIQFDILKHILRFIYNGQVSIEMGKLDNFLEAAEFLGVYGLVNDKIVRNRTRSSEDDQKSEIKPKQCSVVSEADTECRDSPQVAESEVIEIEAGSDDALVTRLLECEGYGFFQNDSSQNEECIDKIEKEDYSSQSVKRSNDWTSDYENVQENMDNLSKNSSAGVLKRKKIKLEQFTVGDNVEIESINERDFANSLDAEIDFTDDDEDNNFLEKEMLNTSLATVTESGFQCNICNKVYIQKDSLRKHFALHTKNTTCAICGLTLSRRTHLKRHMKIHEVATKY